MQDRPTKTELLEGVERFLTNEAIGGLEGPARFHARVAAGAVRMAIREIELEQSELASELASLAELLDAEEGAPSSLEETRARVRALNERLAETIRGGQLDEGELRARVLDHLRRAIVRKLAVTNPAMSARLVQELEEPL